MGYPLVCTMQQGISGAQMNEMLAEPEILKNIL